MAFPTDADGRQGQARAPGLIETMSRASAPARGPSRMHGRARRRTECSRHQHSSMWWQDRSNGNLAPFARAEGRPARRRPVRGDAQEAGTAVSVIAFHAFVGVPRPPRDFGRASARRSARWLAPTDGTANRPDRLCPVVAASHPYAVRGGGPSLAHRVGQNGGPGRQGWRHASQRWMLELPLPGLGPGTGSGNRPSAAD